MAIILIIPRIEEEIALSLVNKFTWEDGLQLIKTVFCLGDATEEI